jgi:hypothetical protein
MFPEQWMAQALYQPLKWAFVSKWMTDEFNEEIDITDFLIDHRKFNRKSQRKSTPGFLKKGGRNRSLFYSCLNSNSSA